MLLEQFANLCLRMEERLYGNLTAFVPSVGVPRLSSMLQNGAFEGNWN
jgi:hypothetical protein